MRGHWSEDAHLSWPQENSLFPELQIFCPLISGKNQVHSSYRFLFSNTVSILKSTDYLLILLIFTDNAPVDPDNTDKRAKMMPILAGIGKLIKKLLKNGTILVKILRKIAEFLGKTFTNI